MAIVDQGYIDPYGGRGLLSQTYSPGGTPYNPAETGGGDVQTGLLALKGALAAPKAWRTASDLFKNGFSNINPTGLLQGAAGALGGAAAGWAGSKLGTWGEGNAGSSIGGAVGGFAGSFLPVPVFGTLLGSAIGSALGGNFGPPPSVGPNSQAWLGDQGGQLGVLGSSGDNGMTSQTMPGLLGNALSYANSFGPTTGLPKHFQVRGGENGMQPTIELGGYMAPMLNDQSLARALAKRGYLNAPGIGEDPQMILSSGRWQQPESIHPRWQSGIYEMPNTGFLQLDTGRANPVPAGMQYIGDNRHATPIQMMGAY